jgi:hypothetical protein
MFFHGLDTASAGFNDLFGNGGPPTQTVTSQAIQGITGDRASADYLDNGIGLIGGLAGGAALSKFATCPSRAEILTQGATEAGAAAKLAIKEGDSLLAIVENGKIVKWSIPNTSHEALAKSAGVFVEKGVLKEGAEAVTIIKQGGKLYVQNSHNFGGAPPASEAACRAANELFK